VYTVLQVVCCILQPTLQVNCCCVCEILSFSNGYGIIIFLIRSFVMSADESLYQKSFCKTTMLETENEWVVDDDEALFLPQGKTPNIPLLIDRFRLCCMERFLSDSCDCFSFFVNSQDHPVFGSTSIQRKLRGSEPTVVKRYTRGGLTKHLR
jgi:hypothetical protein